MVLGWPLSDGMLADAILIPVHPSLPPINIRKVRGRRKCTETKKKKRRRIYSDD